MLNVKTFSLQIIIKIFEIIVYLNVLLSNQRYTYSKQFHKIVINARKIYQDLICCAIKFGIIFLSNKISALENEIEKNFHNHEKKGFLNNELTNLKNNPLAKMLFETTNFSFDSDFEINFSTIIFKSQPASLKIKKQRKRKP